MGTESRGELTRVDRAGTTLNRHFGPRASATHRVAAGSAVAVAGGAGVTGLVAVGMAAGPHLAGVLSAAEPGLIGLGVAGAVTVLGNWMTLDCDLNVYQRALDGLRGDGPLRDHWTAQLAGARHRGEVMHLAVGVGGLIGAGLLATSAAGLDVADVINAHTAVGIGGAAEVLAGVGIAGLLGARFWRGQAAKYGTAPQRSLGE